MEVTLKPDNRKATIIGGISDDLVKVKLEDGRELPWPVSKINMPQKEGEDTLKMVVIPAINRLEELKKDIVQLVNNEIEVNKIDALDSLFDELRKESLKEFKKKWGL